MRKLIFASMLVSLICATNAIAQQQTLSSSESSKANAEKIESFNQVRSALEGYYQIQVINSRANVEISYDLLMKIKENQREDVVVFFDYNEKIRIRILPVKSNQLVDPREKIIHLEN
jgi:hypothetical protein